MARENQEKNNSAILVAAQTWIQNCLIDDGSIFSSENLWNQELVYDINRAFVEHPQEGTEDFITKLKRQMAYASADGCRLMAEVLWALLLFPSNINEDTKRDQIVDIWAESGSNVPIDHPYLKDEILSGIGSGGPGYSTNKWRELGFILSATIDLKRHTREQRLEIFASYDSFMDWMEGVPQEGHRQYRHMLRYFAFPERVERMSSNNERQEVLEKFSVAPRRETKSWSDRQLDTALFQLRERLTDKHPGVTLDFYNTPLREVWKRDRVPGLPARVREQPPATRSSPLTPGITSEGSSLKSARNVIYYGPPGTGKTYKLREIMRAEYTDSPSVDREAWMNSLLSSYGWRPVIVVALSEIGRPARVPDIRDHPLVRAKMIQRGVSKQSMQTTLWGYLQEHTPQANSLVSVETRRPPFVFDKVGEGLWSLSSDWKSADDDAAELASILKAGPRASSDTVNRYRSVTFHPSYSYEDFVRGIRPVPIDETRTTQFQLVDGVFKRICDEARRNPTKRYALFIDEINRANIAKVFGELISLIEVDKRTTYDSTGRLVNGMTVQLLGGEESNGYETPFGVPTNLDIYGSMNTADRSIALLDVALRRRFEFKELEPDYTTLESEPEGIHLGRLLQRINDRLEYFLDRDHRIGHAYLMRAATIEELRSRFENQIIPLLQEFFFEDLSRVGRVLATTSSAPFVERQKLKSVELFSGRSGSGSTDRLRYVVTPSVTWSKETFQGIYAGLGDEEAEVLDDSAD